jgi:predicted 2-oxoglutarate/Fe(II)-dependent dioxygenase YbiX
MPDAAFFRKLGLFLDDKFLDAAACARIVAELRAAPAERGTVVGGREVRESGGAVEENRRKVWNAQVQAATETEISDRLERVRPRLEAHFDVRLGERQGPHFLRYDEGGFHVPHSDVRPDSPPEIRNRAVSVVIFLNPLLKNPADGDGYCGGELVLYNLIDDPKWKGYGFPLEATTGLMLAYRSHETHEIRPVKSGRRFTIVAWYSHARG